MTSSPHNAGGRVSLPTFEELVEAGAIVAPLYHEDAGDDGADDADKAARSDDPAAERLARERSRLNAQARRVKQECDKMREDAQREAMSILAEANEQAQGIREKAKAEMEQTIRARYEQEIGRLRDTVDKAAAGFLEKKEELFSGLRARMLDTCIDIAQDILRYELDKSADAYMSIVQNAVALLDTDEAMTLRVPPVAYDRLFGGANNTLLRQMEDRRVKVLKDNDVKDGDALVTTERGNLRVGAQTQSSRLREAVLSKWGEKP